jgi:hypothetical protein
MVLASGLPAGSVAQFVDLPGWPAAPATVGADGRLRHDIPARSAVIARLP